MKAADGDGNILYLDYLSVSLSVMSYSLWPMTVACQAPLSINSPGKNTGLVSHSLLQGISWPGIQPRSPVLQADSLISEPPGDPHLDCIQCQYAGCDILLQFYKVLLLKLGKGYMRSLCYSYFFCIYFILLYFYLLYSIVIIIYVWIYSCLKIVFVPSLLYYCSN